MDLNAPYLPPLEPTDNPVAVQKKSIKVVLLWLLLILMFVSIYQLFTGPATPHIHGMNTPPPPPPPASPWWDGMIAFVPGVGITAFLILIWRRMLRARRS